MNEVTHKITRVYWSHARDSWAWTCQCTLRGSGFSSLESSARHGDIHVKLFTEFEAAAAS